MALNYTNLFTDLGKLVKEYIAFGTTAEALPARVAALLSQFNSTGELLSVDGIDSQYDSWRDSYAGRRGSIGNFALQRLQDKTTVLDQIGAASNQQSDIFTALIRQMIADSQTVNASVPTIGSVTFSGTGNGQLVLTSTLDGTRSPRNGVNAQLNYANKASEFVLPAENMVLTCTADSYSGNTNEGGEGFQWTGQIAQNDRNTTRPEGSGGIGAFQVTNGSQFNLLTNGDFESFSSNTPTGWTIDNGAAGTEVFQDTGTFYHALSALKFTGTAATSIQVSQPVTIIPNQSYVCGVWIKADATVSAGDLTISLQGTGYSPATSEKIAVAHGSLPTAWTFHSFVYVAPKTPPSDLKLAITWGGTPTSGKHLWFDDVAFGSPVYGGGLGASLFRGNIPFVSGDRFAFPVSAVEGLFQSFMRRAFGVVLNSSGSPTIADGLAT